MRLPRLCAHRPRNRARLPGHLAGAPWGRRRSSRRSAGALPEVCALAPGNCVLTWRVHSQSLDGGRAGPVQPARGPRRHAGKLAKRRHKPVQAVPLRLGRTHRRPGVAAPQACREPGRVAPRWPCALPWFAATARRDFARRTGARSRRAPLPSLKPRALGRFSPLRRFLSRSTAPPRGRIPAPMPLIHREATVGIADSRWLRPRVRTHPTGFGEMPSGTLGRRPAASADGLAVDRG